MNKKEIKYPGKTADTGAYSAGVWIDDWLFISGQGPINMETGDVIRGTIEEETALTLRHIERIIKEAGGTMNDIVKCTVHLSDINDFARFNKTYASVFAGIKPARTTVQSILSDEIKVEIDAIAKISKK